MDRLFFDIKNSQKTVLLLMSSQLILQLMNGEAAAFINV